jgi:hypothetical protein
MPQQDRLTDLPLVYHNAIAAPQVFKNHPCFAMSKTDVTPRHEAALELEITVGRSPDHEFVSVDVQFLVPAAKSISPIRPRHVSDCDLPARTSPSAPGRIDFRWFSHGTPRWVSIRENSGGLHVLEAVSRRLPVCAEFAHLDTEGAPSGNGTYSLTVRTSPPAPLGWSRRSLHCAASEWLFAAERLPWWRFGECGSRNVPVLALPPKPL